MADLDQKALEADDPICTDCGGTGITHQTERRCACQPALSPVVAAPAAPVGWFNPYNDVHGYQQVAKEHEGAAGTIPLYSADRINTLTAERDGATKDRDLYKGMIMARENLEAHGIHATDAAVKVAIQFKKSEKSALARAETAEAHIAELEAALREARMQALASDGQAQEALGRVAELEEVLKPFAAYKGEDSVPKGKPGILYERSVDGHLCIPDGHGFQCVWADEHDGDVVEFTAGQFRRARSALSKSEPVK